MQGEEVEFDFQSSLLETPSLMTPNIEVTAPPIKSVFNKASVDISHIKNASSMSNSSSSILAALEISSSVSSADAKVSKIQDELKQSLNEPRKPTPSPFQKITSSHAFNLEKPITTFPNDDQTPMEVPSTADVVTELEALTNVNPLQFSAKVLMNDNHERETGLTLNGDNMRYDSSPTINLGPNVSPKKKLLMRSQSHTEPASPLQNNNNQSQSQKVNNDNSILNIQNGIDDENSMDDLNGSFVRTADMALGGHSIETHIDTNQQFKPIIDNGLEQHINIPLKTEQNIISHTMIKQQPVAINQVNNNAKRTFHQTNIGTIPTIAKPNPMIMPQPLLNEVTSTDQLTNAKRQRTVSMPINTTSVNFRTSYPSSSGATVTNTLASSATTNGSNATGGSEDQRKKQIRDSNREAARRCRERRRQYIEQLEGNLEQYKVEVKQLRDKLVRLERENTQLRAILSETKIIHQGSRIAVNESHVDCTYSNVVIPTSMDINSDSSHQLDGRTIQRSYIDRNNL